MSHGDAVSADYRLGFAQGYDVGLATGRGESADLVAALRAIRQAYQDMFEVMPVAWQTFDGIAEAALAEATGKRSYTATGAMLQCGISPLTTLDEVQEALDTRERLDPPQNR